MSRFFVWVALFLAVSGTGLRADSPEWDTYSDTWVATDGLGRVLPGHSEVGSPRPEHTVGIFYFLWLGAHSRQVYDINEILGSESGPTAWGPKGAFHFWSEPLFGYYQSTERFVIRKHAQMLADAGVEVVFFDVTNGPTYDSAWRALGEEYLAMRRLGLKTPAFAFLTHSRTKQVVRHLYEVLYAKGFASELWFRWEGKPLLLAAPGDLEEEWRKFFTVRESWAWSDPRGWFGDGRDRWPWLDHWPQQPGWHTNPETPEQVAVATAQHPVSNIGRSFHNKAQPAVARPELGWCFQEQFDRALQLNPSFVFVTGWNEWVAQRFIDEEGKQNFLGNRLPPGGTYFVDQYSQEFSRDIEPMKGGHEDNFYYQMAANIRRYRGVRPLAPVLPQPIRIDGRFEDWDLVTPEFRDTLGDPVQRDHDGWEGAGRYVNRTGRNDLKAARVSFDEENIYFYLETQKALVPSKLPVGVLLYLDADQDATTGWLGYDWVINRTGLAGGSMSLERNLDGNYAWASAGRVVWQAGLRQLELSIPRTLLRSTTPSTEAGLDFKWADNIRQTGEWSDFTRNGDVAPNDRFNYRAKGIW